MKKVLTVLFIAALTILVNAQNYVEGQTPPSLKGSEQCHLRKINSDGTWITEKMFADIRHSYDALNYKIDLDLYNCFISPYPKSFKGSVTVSFRADSSMSQMKLDANSTSLIIDSVRMSGVSFVHSSNVLTVTLDRVYNPGETGEVKVYYRHNNVTDNAFYVSNGFVFTDCEPEGARKWFPCWDKPHDKATIDLKVKVPATVKLGSNGRLADSVKTADTIYYNWISAHPVATYLVVMTGKVNYNLDIVYWQKLSNPNDSVPMRFYWNTGESTSNLNSMKSKLLLMTTKYSQLFGEHPFEKNGFATLNNQFTWGGMENQTLTSLCPNCWSEWLVAHEFAHQWFGDMITCATWADIFVNEGFATYIEALWTEHVSGYAAYKSEIIGNANSYMSSNPGWAISEPSWAVTTPSTSVLFNYAITYMKASVIHHLLRYILGDAAYFQGMYNYANDPELKYKSAVIADFKNHMSAVYGSDLSWFFDAWIYQPNHPVYANNYWIMDAGGGNWQVGFVAKQTQVNSAFHPMPVEVKVTFASGPDTTIRVMNNVNNQVFIWTFNRQAVSVAFDPNTNIIPKSATLTQIPPIPVELTSFSASAVNGNVFLEWTTATEVNNSGFEIERRSGTETWNSAGFVNGNGTTSMVHNYSFTDVVSGFASYTYRLKQINFDGSFEYSNEVSVTAGSAPEVYELSQNYPNPFNPGTTIKFTVAEPVHVELKVFDLFGSEVRTLVNEYKRTGDYEVKFDASDLASGVYIYRLTAGTYTINKKMNLIK